MRYVFDFSEDSGGGRELLGGKGIGLAEMTALGVPVPDGFTITTEACRAYLAGGGEVPTGLDDEVDEHIAALEQRTGKGFGDAGDPLLVSVRSGAAVSMPGMMDTILNLGLNDVAVEGLAASTGNPRFALDSYRRLIQMYGVVVDGVDGHRFEQALTDLKAARGVSQDVELTADDLRELVATFGSIYEEETRHAFPHDPRDQLRRAYRAVFDSWNAPRARVYRRANDIADDLGTAVNVVQMVFGNRGDTSGHGRVLHPRPRDRRAAALRRVPRERAGRGRRRGNPHAGADRAHARAHAAGLRAARRDARPARSALPRSAGHRVHGRGGDAVHPADAHGQAHGRRRASRRGGDGRRGAHLARGGGRAHRSGPARPAPAPAHRSERDDRGRHARAERVSRRRLRRDRARRGHGRGAGQGRRGRDPRALGDDARRLSTECASRRASSPRTAG